MVGINSIPDELLTHILMYLPGHDILKFGQTAKQFAWVCQDWHFWATKAEQEWNFPPNLFSETAILSPWKQYRNIEVTLTCSDGTAHNDLIEFLTGGITSGLKSGLGKLSFAIGNGNLGLYKHLQNLGIKAHPRCPYEHAVMIEAATRANQRAMIEYLVETDSVEPPQFMYHHVLKTACKSGNIDLFKLATEHGITYEELSPFDIQGAIKSGHLDFIKFLFTEYQLSATSLGIALGDAAREGKLDILKFLAQIMMIRGITEMNAPKRPLYFNCFEWALFLGCKQGHLEIVKFLLGYNLGNQAIMFSLREAINHHQSEVAIFLLNSGRISIDLELEIKRGPTKHGKQGHINLLMFLIDHGFASVDQVVEFIIKYRYRRHQIPITFRLGGVDWSSDNDANYVNDDDDNVGNDDNDDTMINSLINRGSIEVDRVVELALKYHRDTLAKFMIATGLANLMKARGLARKYRRNAVINYLDTHWSDA